MIKLTQPIDKTGLHKIDMAYEKLTRPTNSVKTETL